MPDPTSLPEIGARLAVTRKALGLTQTEMDRRMGSALTNGQAYNVTRPAANGFQLITRSRSAAPATSLWIGFTAGRCTACSLTSAPSLKRNWTDCLSQRTGAFCVNIRYQPDGALCV